LFWAIRGGGGNFGVVTSFEFQLHPVDTVTVGLFFYELDYAGDLLRFWREWIKDAPETYGAFPAFQIAPPLPFVPEDRHGDTFAIAVVHFTGPVEAGDAAMAPFRDLAPRVAEMVAPMPYPWLNGAFDAIFPKGIRSYWKGNYVTELTDAAIEAHLAHGPNVPEVSATMHLYAINGAAHRVASDQTAFAYRNATFAPVYIAAWPDSADDEARIKWVRDYYQATAPHSEPGGYINFMQDDDQGRIQDNYRGNYGRLVDIKRKYDPGNLFHDNQNIKP
jgi:FAD/FMN-containing dehydrogenase